MNRYHNIPSTIWTLLLSAFLGIFTMLSMNSIVPLKCQFPSWKLSPHLSTVKTVTENGTRTDYINSQSTITVALDKNYSTVVKTIDQNGNCILEQYFDDRGKPAILINGNSALRKEYNAKGQWIYSTYLDSELKPITGANGYASIHRTYNEIGKPYADMYYDAFGLPTLDLSKRYGILYKYNTNQQITIITSLDADGNAKNNIDHYATIKKTYNSAGKLLSEVFYDENGTPAKLSYGQYGYIYENGKPICVDQNGRKIFVLRHFLHNSILAVLLIGNILILLILLSSGVLTRTLLFLYLAFIACMTIIDRETGSGIVTWSIPPNYYLFFINREILANIWLFIPLGAILYKMSHMWEIIVLPVALSLTIETAQLVFDIGAFELVDLIANSLGGVIGVLVLYLLEPLVQKGWNKPRTHSW